MNLDLHLKYSLVSRLRVSSLLDGLSYVILLGIAMPLKYLADQPLAVRIVGSLHGLFFLALCWYLLRCLLAKKLSFGWCVLVFVCALVPLAPFFLDRKLIAKDGIDEVPKAGRSEASSPPES